MSYTYNPAAGTDKDKIRLLIPDRVELKYSPPAIFEDEEIALMLSTFSNDVLRTAAALCEVVAMDAAKQAIAISLPVGISINKSQIPGYFLQRSRNLTAMADKADQDGAEYIDYFDYEIDKFGYDVSEYLKWRT